MNIIDNGHIVKKVCNNTFIPILEEFNLTQNELSVILYLSEASDEYNTQKHIVDCCMFSKSHVSQSVDSLLKKDLIYKKEDEKDKKKMHLYLTDSANPILESASKKHDELLKVIFTGFSEEEISNIKDYSNRLFENIKNLSND